MDTRTAIILQAEPSSPDSIAARFLGPLKRRILEIEKEVDGLRERYLVAETNLTLERNAHTRDKVEAQQILQIEKEARSKDVEWYISELARKDEERTLLEEQVAELTSRPKDHWHDPDEPQPVLAFDLDGTLKPQIDKGDGGNYPLTDEHSDPYPKVKKWMDRWKSLGACIHITTAGLYYDGPGALEVYEARLTMINSWIIKYGLPVDLVLPKIPCDVYYDDRMVEIPGDPALIEGIGPIPDWDKIGIFAEQQMEQRFFVDDTGIWTRKIKKRIGEEIENWPDGKLFRDHPRGYSGPRLDVDLHRTLSEASSSMRVAPPREDAIETMQKLYESGVNITVSCAGWNRQTHTLVDSIRSLAGIRQWLGQWSVPYDRVAEKDHADIYFDDKGVRYTGWKADLSRIKAKLPGGISYSE